MARFTKALRQQIIEDFARANNGWFDPHAFLDHVRQAGADHPAFEWFQWDDTAAAEAYRLEQSRDFARGLTVTFKVEEIRSKPVTVSAPQFVSPMETRKSGGGYMQMDVNDADHMAELSKQAAQHLAWWLRRYEAVIVSVGGDLDRLQALQSKLEAVQAAQVA